MGSAVMLRDEGESTRHARRSSDQFQLGKQYESDSAAAGRRGVGELHRCLLGVALSGVVSEMWLSCWNKGAADTSQLHLTLADCTFVMHGRTFCVRFENEWVHWIAPHYTTASKPIWKPDYTNQQPNTAVSLRNISDASQCVLLSSVYKPVQQ